MAQNTLIELGSLVVSSMSLNEKHDYNTSFLAQAKQIFKDLHRKLEQTLGIYC